MAEKHGSSADHHDAHAHAEAHGAAKDAHGAGKEAHGAAKDAHSAAHAAHGAAKEEHGAANEHGKAAAAHTEAKKEHEAHAAAHDGHGHEAHHPDHTLTEHRHGVRSNREPISHVIYSSVRNPLYKLLRNTVVASAFILPPVGLSILATKLAVDNTLGRTPVVGQLYKDSLHRAVSGLDYYVGPRQAARVAGLAAAAGPWTAEQLAQGISGVTLPEAQGPLGRLYEGATEGAGKLIRGAGTLLRNGMDGGMSMMKGVWNTGWGMGKHIGPLYVKHPILAPLVTMGIIGGIYQLGFLGASSTVWNAGLGILQGTGKALQGLGTWLSGA